MAKPLTDEQFEERLREAGWTEPEIREHMQEIADDDESGYDGPA